MDMLSSARVTIGALLISLLLAPTFSAAQQTETDDRPIIRVRLLDGDDAPHIRLRPEAGPIRLIDATNDLPLIQLPPGDDVRIGTRSREVYLRRKKGGLYAQALRVTPTEGTQWSLAAPDAPFRTYVGDLIIEPDSAHPDKLQLVNVVPLEDYVASVVASEYTMDDAEGAKAMAVVARTYALRGADKFGTSYDHVDHIRSQVYKGAESITPEARAAAQATRGEVLTYNDSLIEAVYFSSSGGHTADNEDVWNASEALPYLRGKADPYNSQSPHRTWTASVPRSKLLDHLSNRFGHSVEGFLIDDRSSEGRVSTIDILVEGRDDPLQMQANAFRLFVNDHFPGGNLKSTWFDARRSGNRYVFEGRGYGHGVGLSQWGAHEMASRGYDYRDILTFYYTDVSIQTLDHVEVEASPPIAAEQRSEPDIVELDTTTTKTRRIGW